MNTAYGYVKAILRKFRKSSVKNIDRLQYDLYNHEKTRSISEEDMDALRKRAAAALDKQEQKKAAKRKVLTEEQLKKSKFWRMMNGEREKK